VTAAAALARAEAVGLRLTLRPDGAVRMEAAAPPPPEVVAYLRRWREDVAGILAARHRQAARPAAPPPPDWPDGFLYLSGLAVRLDVALRGGATVTRCPSGALDLTLSDGRLWLLSPDTVARLAAARLLPGHLAERVPDPIEAAERAAVFGAEAAPQPYRPGERDALRDGLLRGWRNHRPAG
jgi:hypothetical protein